MAFINKCSVCGNKGFLLKLDNGLCIDCQNELKDVENEYTKFLQDISLNPNDKENYSNKLSELYPKINKFSTYSLVLNMDVVSQLISSLSLKVDMPSIDTSEKNNISSEITTDVNLNISDNNDTINETDTPIDDISTVPSNFSLEEISSLAAESFDDLSDNTIKPLFNASDKLIMDNLYNNTSNIINLLNDTNLSLNELGKNFFKLKDSFYPALKQYDIDEVNGTNIKSFIDTLERKLCHLTNRTPDTLYDFFNYVTLALQTSGVNKDSNYILEISALKINYGDIIDEFYTLINPITTIRSDVSKRTGITSDMVASAPTLDIALSNFKDFIENNNLVIYNSSNVLSFLNHNYNKLFGYTLKNSDTCCLRLYRTRYKNFHGTAPKVYDIYSICTDILTKEDLDSIEDFNSIAKSTSLAVYKLFEILKSKYK